ncbi:MAG: DUF6941 family protein [Candidatus Binataceae bacterium]
MKIESAILADAAQAANGKLFILGGGWNIYRAANYPVPVQMAVAFMVSFDTNEVGNNYPLTITIADEAGVPIAPAMQGHIAVSPPPSEMPKEAPLKLPFAVNMGLQIPRAGKYGILITAGSSKAQLQFDAIFVGSKVQFDFPGSTERGN